MPAETLALLKTRIAERVANSADDVFVPDDFSDLGPKGRVYKALSGLVSDEVLGKLGHGVYGRLRISSITNKPILATFFGTAVRQALRKLNIPFDECQARKENDAGLSTQVLANTVLVLRR